MVASIQYIENVILVFNEATEATWQTPAGRAMSSSSLPSWPRT